MKSATKVLLESIQVSRQIGRFAMRPVEKAVVQVANATEEVVHWTLTQKVTEEMLGQQRTKQAWDGYLQVKQVVGEGLGSLSHQSLMSALQSGAQASTGLMRQAGLQGRVVGPFDEHWNTLKVLRDLRSASATQSVSLANPKQKGRLKLTPKRIVQFMREAERRKKRELRRDPVEAYVERLLNSGSLTSGLGAMQFEKKLYTDVARIICFVFDLALLEANGTELWGHELHITKRRAREVDTVDPLRVTPSRVGVQQVEAAVDQMLRSEDLRVMVAMKGIQRHVITNTVVMILQLLEYLTSEHRMQVTLLGHSLRFCLDPIPLDEMVTEAMHSSNDPPPRFDVNEKAIDELVDALLAESEIQLVFVPDLIEGEVYRWALHRMICITQAILAQLRIRLFGIEVHLNLSPDMEDVEAEGSEKQMELSVLPSELQMCLVRVEEERRRIKRELSFRQEEDQANALSSDAPPGPAREGAGDLVDEDAALWEDGQEHEFTKLAALDRLARSLAIQHELKVPIEMAYDMVSNFDEYPTWMPFCTSARTIADGTSSQVNVSKCEVGFGFETGTILGTVGDSVRYQVLLTPPAVKVRSSVEPAGGIAGNTNLKVARVVADAVDGFAYGKRLVYDWRFSETESGVTKVRLDMFFQATSVFTLPIWDSMQAIISGVMMKKFLERANTLMEKEAAVKRVSQSGSGNASRDTGRSEAADAAKTARV
mmetsp:Transcript_3723/g.6779  ORF Transcript_3723/g.6779 Transcript_3723/m.6779 type:complete len:712 (+) Transcript_3723:95-2230(+)